MRPLAEDFYRRKLGQIQGRLAETEHDGILLLNQHNVIYSTGFFHSPSERPIGVYLPADGEPTLYIPLLEQENAAQGWLKDIRSYHEFPGTQHPIAWMMADSGAKRLAVDQLDHALWLELKQDRAISMSSLVNQLRYVKEDEELVLIRRAAHYADYFLEYLFEQASMFFQQGASEVEILNACLEASGNYQRQDLGEAFAGTKVGITATVHSGPRAALPHGKPLQRKPRHGEVLIAGIGASVAGYHAESGATFVLGDASSDQLRCLKAAAACNDAAVASLRPGNNCQDVNEAALEQLSLAGLDPFIRHRIGHGMGIEGHEAPWLAPGDDTTLAAKMVFSNEPGIYRPGLDGYRTINTMIVTNSEAEVPSQFLKTHPPETRVLDV